MTEAEGINAIMELTEMNDELAESNEYLKEANNGLKSMLIESQRIIIELQREHIAYQDTIIADLMPFPDEDDESRSYH